MFRDLAEDAEQVSAQEFADALFGIAAAQHGLGNLGQVADVAHAARQWRPAIEVVTQAG